MGICFCKTPGSLPISYLFLLHGEVTADDLKGWKAELLSKLSSPTDFERYSALFLERAAKVHLEEPMALSALVGLFEKSFSHLLTFLQTMGRFYEANPRNPCTLK
jgi:hypothetical protein